MINVLHAADLHLDSAFSALSPEQARLRRQEQREIPMQLAELANAHGCELLLLAGDLFDSESVYPETVEALQRAFCACRCDVLIAPGNHDFCAPGSAYLSAKWPENVHIFKKSAIECVEYPQLSCRVYGAGFEHRDTPALLTGFSAKQDGMTELMVLHGDCMSADSPYDPVSRAEIAASGLTYLALGHTHGRSELKKEGQTFYAWPGCAMGRGFDECGEKGAYLVHIENGGCRAEFLPLPGRRYELLTVSVTDDALGCIRAMLPEDTKNDIYRIILRGQSEKIDVSALYGALSDSFFALSIRDETEPPRALWDGCGEESLRGIFLETLKQQYAAADENERRVLALAAEYGLDAMDGREVTA